MNNKCLLNGKPFNGDLPPNAIFVGMEQNPNEQPRYNKLTHPWFNKPCYETPDYIESFEVDE